MITGNLVYRAMEKEHLHVERQGDTLYARLDDLMHPGRKLSYPVQYDTPADIAWSLENMRANPETCYAAREAEDALRLICGEWKNVKDDYRRYDPYVLQKHPTSDALSAYLSSLQEEAQNQVMRDHGVRFFHPDDYYGGRDAMMELLAGKLMQKREEEAEKMKTGTIDWSNFPKETYDVLQQDIREAGRRGILASFTYNPYGSIRCNDIECPVAVLGTDAESEEIVLSLIVDSPHYQGTTSSPYPLLYGTPISQDIYKGSFQDFQKLPYEDFRKKAESAFADIWQYGPAVSGNSSQLIKSLRVWKENPALPPDTPPKTPAVQEPGRELTVRVWQGDGYERGLPPVLVSRDVRALCEEGLLKANPEESCTVQFGSSPRTKSAYKPEALLKYLDRYFISDSVKDQYIVYPVGRPEPLRHVEILGNPASGRTLDGLRNDLKGTFSSIEECGNEEKPFLFGIYRDAGEQESITADNHALIFPIKRLEEALGTSLGQELVAATEFNRELFRVLYPTKSFQHDLSMLPYPLVPAVRGELRHLLERNPDEAGAGNAGDMDKKDILRQKEKLCRLCVHKDIGDITLAVAKEMRELSVCTPFRLSSNPSALLAGAVELVVNRTRYKENDASVSLNQHPDRLGEVLSADAKARRSAIRSLEKTRAEEKIKESRK